MGMTLREGHLRSGVWEAVVVADLPPAVEALHDGTILPDLALSPLAGRPGEWLLRLPVPVERLDEGVQTFLLRSVPEGETLGHFHIVAGEARDGDLRAEIDLLRAESTF